MAKNEVEHGASNSLLAAKMHEAVRLAARLHFYRAECLPKSVVLADMLTKRGLNAVVAIGVNKKGDSLTSHAWVELDGLMIGEPESIRQDFTSLTY